jgi:hypothetical protein
MGTARVASIGFAPFVHNFFSFPPFYQSPREPSPEIVVKVLQYHCRMSRRAKTPTIGEHLMSSFRCLGEASQKYEKC